MRNDGGVGEANYMGRFGGGGSGGGSGAEGEAVQGGSRSWHPLKGSQVGMNPSATVVALR